MLCFLKRVTVQLNYSLVIGQLIMKSNQQFKVTSYLKRFHLTDVKTRLVISIVQTVVVGIP